MTIQVTKWDLISDSYRESLKNTPFGQPCTGCGTPLATEADFAKHFVLYNRSYRNLGYCPKKGPQGLAF